MAQSQAGLGNLEKANKALNQAIGLDPSLKFASKTNIQNLKKAITPQSEMIEPVHESSHFWLFLILAIMGGYGIYWLYNKPKKPDSVDKSGDKPETPPNTGYARSPDIERNAANAANIAQQYPFETRYPINSTPRYTPQPQTVVYNNSSNSDGLLTGMIIGDMLGSRHDTTIIHEKEIIHDTPQNDNSWENTSKKDDSWNDTASSSPSWDSDSGSSSSWDDSSSSDSSWGE